jgi:hypothetical protein
MRKFRLLKDLPGVNAGAIFEEYSDAYHFIDTNGCRVAKYAKELVENNHEWFEEVKLFTEQEILLSICDAGLGEHENLLQFGLKIIKCLKAK